MAYYKPKSRPYNKPSPSYHLVRTPKGKRLLITSKEFRLGRQRARRILGHSD